MPNVKSVRMVRRPDNKASLAVNLNDLVLHCKISVAAGMDLRRDKHSGSLPTFTPERTTMISQRVVGYTFDDTRLISGVPQ